MYHIYLIYTIYISTFVLRVLALCSSFCPRLSGHACPACVVYLCICLSVCLSVYRCAGLRVLFLHLSIHISTVFLHIYYTLSRLCVYTRLRVSLYVSIRVHATLSLCV